VDPVVHFEMPYQDSGRMARFYQAAFGWETKPLGQESGNYVLANTSETDDSGPKRKGVINGGFFPKKSDMPAQHPAVVIAVEKLDVAMKRVKEAGGKVLGEPMDIPDVGKYVSFDDTEGNRVSMLEPTPANKEKSRRNGGGDTHSPDS